MVYVNMAYIVMALYRVMAYVNMAYIVMAYVNMAYVVMAYIGMADIVILVPWNQKACCSSRRASR